MNNKLKIIILVIIIIIFGIVSTTLLNTSKNKKQVVIDYLNSKYGNGGWNIISSEDYIYENSSGTLFSEEYVKDGVKFKISSAYLDGKFFFLYVNSSNMITDDYFIPTYYSIKYNLEYDDNPDPGDNSYSDLVDKMVYISTYHYPYKDYICSSSGWYSGKPKCKINSFLMRSFYSPISVQTSPEKEKVLDVIPDEQRIPELNEIVELVEAYYSSGRAKNKDNHEQELYDLIFNQKASENEITNFILNHVTNVDGLEVINSLDINNSK